MYVLHAGHNPLSLVASVSSHICFDRWVVVVFSDCVRKVAVVRRHRDLPQWIRCLLEDVGPRRVITESDLTRLVPHPFGCAKTCSLHMVVLYFCTWDDQFGSHPLT